MKVRTPFIFIIIMSFNTLIAQNNDSIRQLILEQKDTDLEIITKGRSLTNKQLSEGDITGLRDTKEFLINEMSDPYNVFFSHEYWLILFWTEDYSDILFEVKKFTENSYLSIYNANYHIPSNRYNPSPMLRMVAENDGLHKNLGRKSAESYLSLSVNIDNAQLISEEKEFLKLLLFSILFTPENPTNDTMNEINERATEFLTKYPESEYSDYTRKYIRYEYAASSWGFGYEFALGYGNAFGEFGNNLRGGIAGGMTLEILYKQAHLNARFNILSSASRNDLTVNGLTWPAKKHGNIYTADIAIEYPVYKSRTIKLIPFIGIGAVGVGVGEKTKEEYPELEDFKELSAFSYLTGLDLRFNFWNKDIDLSRNGGYSVISLRYSYYFPRYSNKYDFLNGNLHVITVGIGSFGRPIKRKF